jgi:signal transduction histidine kinase
VKSGNRDATGEGNELDLRTSARRREESLRFLSEASAALSESLDDERGTMETLGRLAIEHLADGCMITLAWPDGRWEHVVTVSREPERALLNVEVEHRFPLSPDAPAGYARVLRTGEAELIPPEAFHDDVLPKITANAEHLALLRRLDMYSGLCVPLTTRGRVLGAITLVLMGPVRRRPFDDADLELCRELGRRAALALDNARLFSAEHDARERAEQSAARIAALQATTAALSGALTPVEVAEAIVSSGVSALRAQAGSVASISADGAALEILASVGYSTEAVRNFFRTPLGTAFPLTDAARTREPIILHDAAERDQRYPHLAELRRANGGGAMAALPLLARDRLLGAMGLNFPDGRVLSDEDFAFIDAIARQCAQALDRARLYAAEQEARAEAEAASAAKSQFLATVSHETRQPIHATIGWVELMEMGLRGPLTDQQREDLARIRHNQRRLLDLINDILSFAKNEAGVVDFFVRDVDTAEVVAALEPLVGPQFAARSVVLHVDATRAPAFRGDRDRAVQICLNLVTNALKASPDGGTVRVWTSDDSEAERTVAIHVADTGAGIPTEKLELIFEPFTQLGRALNNPAEGVGLGLAICRQLARAMGGDVLAQSTLGKGSIFTVRLPAASRTDGRG